MLSSLLPEISPANVPSREPLCGTGLAQSRPLPFAQEASLSDPNVEMVPRKRLVAAARTPRVDVRLPRPLAQRPSPVAVESRRHLDEIRDAPIAPREERLQAGFARILVHHAH